MYNFFQKSLINRIAVQFHGKYNIFMHIQDRNEVVILKNKSDITATKNRQLLGTFFR